MAVIFSDDFNRADSTSLGANWTEANSDSSIASNRLQVGPLTGGGTNAGRVVTTTSAHAAIADCRVTVTKVSASGDGGPVARDTGAATPTMYAIDQYPNVLELYRHNASTSGTLLATGISGTPAANDVLALEVTGTGGTVTVKSYVNGVLKQTVNDTNAARITAAGRCGVYSWPAVAGANTQYDDFSVDDLASAASPFFARLGAQRIGA